jgi:hypothetical protein
MGTVSAPAGDVSGTTAPTNEPVQEAITHIVTDVKDGKGLDAAGSESDEGTVKVEDDSSPPLGENVDGEKGLPAPALAPGDPGPPPDGGLTAWLQVLSNFLIHFFGVGFSNGGFHSSRGNAFLHANCRPPWPKSTVMGVFIRYYYQTGFFGPNITQTSLALMGGVSQLVSFAFGPAIGILSDKFGYMPVSTIGSICFGIFTIIAGFSNGIFAVAFVFQGVLQGISFMASWIPSMGALSQWFGKRRGGYRAEGFVSASPSDHLYRCPSIIVSTQRPCHGNWGCRKRTWRASAFIVDPVFAVDDRASVDACHYGRLDAMLPRSVVSHDQDPNGS